MEQATAELFPQLECFNKPAPEIDSSSTTPSAADCATARIMVIDDEPINIRVVTKYLNVAGFTEVEQTADSAKALELIISYRPDVLILDIMMPEVSGLDIMRQLQQDSALRRLPVVVLTASDEKSVKLEALNLGATDFLAKPVDPLELTPRIRNAIDSKRYHDHLENYSRELEAAVRRKTAELELSRREVLQCLARAAEFRDDDTGQHIVRVGKYAALTARKLGFSNDYVDMIEQAAQLHDVGKIGISDELLGKPGKLTSEEFDEVRRHSGFGKKILQSLSHYASLNPDSHSRIGSRILEDTSSPLLQMAYRIALTHHERWDGAGYPIGLSGTDIPIEGRITAVADVFDALSSKRPYKKPYPIDECFNILEEGKGSHFDPQVVEAFVAMRREALQVQVDLLDIE